VTDNVEIRFYREEDYEQAYALEARIGPYRPEDQPEVEAMFERARRAEASGDPRWGPFPPPSDAHESREILPDALTGWVAIASNDRKDQIVGMAALRPFREEHGMTTGLSIASEWGRSGKVVSLKKVRVAPERWGQGIGTWLCRTAMEWAHANDFEKIVVETTSPQLPALNLYRKLGFVEVGRCYIGPYELVWSELLL
jgi:GNAT superfamily N-acetyltransferase